MHNTTCPTTIKGFGVVCPKPYFRLVNNSKQWQTHKVHEKLIKIHIKITPNGVTDKKIQALQVTGTCYLQREAHFSTKKHLATDYQHASK